MLQHTSGVRQEQRMPLGAIGAVRVFTRNLEVAKRFYAETLGLTEIHARRPDLCG